MTGTSRVGSSPGNTPNTEETAIVRRQRLLPAGWDSIADSYAGNGWALCWTDREAAAWHPGVGWIRLPVIPGVSLGTTPEIEAVGLKDGILVAHGVHPVHACFWEWGAVEWKPLKQRAIGNRPFSTASPVTRIDLFPGRDNLAIGRLEDRTLLFRCGPGEVEYTIVPDVHSPGSTIGAWQDGDGTIRVLGYHGLIELDPEPPHASKLQPPHRLSGRKIIVPSMPAGQRAKKCVAIGIMQDATEVDLADGTSHQLGLADIPGCGALWRAWIDGDTDLVREIVGAAANLRAAVFEPTSIKDVVILDGRVAGIVTHSGIWEPDRPAGDLDPFPPTDAAAPGIPYNRFVPATVLVTWQLFLDPVRALPLGMDAIGGAGRAFLSKDCIIEALRNAGGDSVCERFLDHARARDPGFLDVDDLDVVRELFERCGAGAGRLVHEALADASVNVMAAACAAAGACIGSESAGISEKSVPVLWGADEPAPVDELCVAAGHRDSVVAIAAAGALMRLAAVGAVPSAAALAAVLPLLDREDENVREAAFNALENIPLLTDRDVIRLDEALQREPHDGARRKGIEALRANLEHLDRFDSLIAALSDVDVMARFSAAKGIEANAGTCLTVDRALSLFDAWAVLRIAARNCPSGFGFELGVEDVLTDAMKAFLEGMAIESDEQLEAFIRERPDEGRLITLFITLAVIGAVLEPRTEGVEPGEALGVAERFAALGVADLLTEADIVEALRPRPVLARFDPWFRRLQETWPEFAIRLAIAVIARVGIRRRPLSGKTPTPVGFLPFHDRLRALESGVGLYERLIGLVRDQAVRDDVCGLLALLVLAAAGDGSALPELEARLLSGRLNGVPIAMEIVANTSIGSWSESERKRIASAFLIAPPIPFLLRYRVWKTLGQQIFEGDDEPFLQELAAVHGQFPFDDRRGAAESLLLRRQDPGPLIDVWERYRVMRDLRDPERLQHAGDMLRCGRMEYMSEFRRLWARSPDVDGWQILKQFGEVSDIPLIESAVRRGQMHEGAAEKIRAAIRERLVGHHTERPDSQSVTSKACS